MEFKDWVQLDHHTFHHQHVLSSLQQDEALSVQHFTSDLPFAWYTEEKRLWGY